MKYEILTYTLCDGFINTWTDDDGDSVVFDTLAEAEKELAEYVHDLEMAYAEGDLSKYSAEDFKIAPVR